MTFHGIYNPLKAYLLGNSIHILAIRIPFLALVFIHQIPSTNDSNFGNLLYLVQCILTPIVSTFKKWGKKDLEYYANLCSDLMALI